jgi:hypothetical protein
MLRPEWRVGFFWLLILWTLPQVAEATHMIAVEIRAKPIDCSKRTYEITLIGYVNTASMVLFGGFSDSLSFGDGQSVIVPEQPPVIVDAILNIGRVQYTILHTYATAGQYVLSYREHARNEGIMNMDESGLTTFYTETSVTIADGSCDSSPYLTVPPIDRACSRIAYYHNPGATDLDDDSLSFSLVTPKSNRNTEVVNYLSPHDRKFYAASGMNYSQGNESRDGPPGFVIDPSDGTLSWDAPGVTGEYALAIKVTAWRFNESDSSWSESGFSIRDMQVIVEDCNNNKPDLDVAEDFCVIAGTKVEFTIAASDPDGDPVVMEAFSDIFSLEDSPAQVSPSGILVQSTAAPYDTAAVRIVWNTNCEHVKSQPYKIVFKVTDNPADGPRLVRFKTVSVKVIAPPPEFENVTLNPIAKELTLTWKDYPCSDVQRIQVWRRVSEYKYEQPECNIGMPYFLHYTLIATLPGDSENYSDSELSVGAQYCYRIVALIGDNRIPSRISIDTCVIPRPAEAPVITNVSVLTTSQSNGRIQVRWTSPFNIEKNQYPPPYQYKVYRSDGLGNNNFVQLSDLAQQDTVYSDDGLNTQDLAYEYRVELFVPTISTGPVDTSSVASSVFLRAEPLPNKIRLSWEANTPWYNYIQAYPYHLIYRSESGPSGPFILIDSVEVNQNGFQFIDAGVFQDRMLIEDQIYYYRVLTRGSYGNPGISEPLENFSQIAGSAILDIKPPCMPTVVIEKTECGNLDCATDSYYNTISWSFDDNNCLEAELKYRVFVSDSENGAFDPLATVTGTSFQHSNLNSLAKCYSVAAIDIAGNISALSTPVCNDNCPYFELPNVFTPGSDDGWNDQLLAFGSETGSLKCARFVKQVDLKIFNRWGEEVYSVVGAVPDESYIFWDGQSNSGKEIESGVYFYSANVTFDVRDPAMQNKIIKGWVHLIRSH